MQGRPKSKKTTDFSLARGINGGPHPSVRGMARNPFARTTLSQPQKILA
jgi:hypothetical protein